jgi:hypothetical protein
MRLWLRLQARYWHKSHFSKPLPVPLPMRLSVSGPCE